MWQVGVIWTAKLLMLLKFETYKPYKWGDQKGAK